MQIHANVSHIRVKDQRQAPQEGLPCMLYFCCDSRGGLYLITAFYLKSESPPHGSVCWVGFQEIQSMCEIQIGFQLLEPVIKAQALDCTALQLYGPGNRGVTIRNTFCILPFSRLG